MTDDLPTEPNRVSAAVSPGLSSERRDVQRAIEHWQRNTWAKDCIPFLDTFDFSSMRGDWGYRFLICGGHAVEKSVFVTYGPKFAQLLGLPDEALTSIPFIQQIPEPYRDMFIEGCNQANTESSPVILEGTFGLESNLELFRTVFMPILLKPNWSNRLILGSFNCRAVGHSGSTLTPVSRGPFR
jgi:hypothetical protein